MTAKTNYTFPQAFFRLNSGISMLPTFWYWFIQGLVVLYGIVPLFFWGQSLSRWVFSGFIVGVLLMTWLTKQFDFSRILGLAHVAWVPGYLLTWQNIGQAESSTLFSIWVIILIVIGSITLFFDVVDIVRWLRGERDVHVIGLDQPLIFREEVAVNAPAAAVWSTLGDYSSYPDWNPLVQSVTGETNKLGGNIMVKVTPLPFKLSAEIDLLEENKAVGWTDQFPLKMLTARPVSTIIDKNDGTSTYVFEETFAGPAVPLLAGNLRKQLPPIYKKLVAAVKERAEANYS